LHTGNKVYLLQVSVFGDLCHRAVCEHVLENGES